MNLSDRGETFIHGHEGEVLTAYLDPVGVVTIGRGVTNRSAVATFLLKAMGIPGGKLVAGKTKITRAQSAQLFKALMDAEFEPYVERKMPAKTKQHEFDMACSAVWNLGPEFMDWKAAEAWRAGRLVEAARIWASNYNTAGGKKLPGLVRRRREEAAIFLNGYAGAAVASTDGPNAPEGVQRVETAAPPITPDPVVKEAQVILKEKGFDLGDKGADGWMGSKTAAAIKAYQEQHPHLTADGKLGVATLTQLRKDAVALRETATKALPTVLAVTGGSWLAGVPTWAWFGVAAVVVGLIVYFGWKYRDIWTRQINGVTGGKSEV